MKGLKEGHITAVQVIVFPFRVEDQSETWKEQGQRQCHWFRYQEAATQVSESSLRRLIRDFGAARTPHIIAHGLQHYRAWRLSGRV